MGPARAYLLPMMKPNTINTRMMVPATATTAMMMTGFCSLETIAADEVDTDKKTHTDRRSERVERSDYIKDQNLQDIIEPNERSGLINPPPPPPPFIPYGRVGGGPLLFLIRPRTHGSTVSESGLNSPRRRWRCPSSQTKTHSGWIVSHPELSENSGNCLR